MKTKKTEKEEEDLKKKELRKRKNTKSRGTRERREKAAFWPNAWIFIGSEESSEI